MNILRQKIVLYILIAGSSMRSTSRPTHSDLEATPELTENYSRIERQIVQPKWLNPGNQETTVDPIVHVNEEALKEADMIRKSILKAVEEDTYAVTGEEANTKDFVKPVSNRPVHLPSWQTNFRKFWQNWAQDVHI